MRIIREVRENDLENIKKIASTAIRECVADSDELHRLLTDDICLSFEWWKSNKEQSLHLLCEENGMVLGVILVKEYWNLSSLFVDPSLHCTGVGRDLINEAIAICSTKSPKGCLKLNSSNYAVPFYKKVGFTQTGKGIDRPGGCVPFEYNF
tara:strand:+ start:61 stop:513 length:453 start_codon:yes stop_codon:yes gene_type:complete